MWLMREDSDLAEQVMLHFIKMGYPCLPVHDSFIVHHGLAGELEDKMKAVFTKRYGVAPKIKLIEADRSVPGSDSFEAVTKDLFTLRQTVTKDLLTRPQTVTKHLLTLKNMLSTQFYS